MSDIEQTLEIQLADGRIIIGRPRPEDQPWLAGLGSDATITLGASDQDTTGHATSADVELDVSGHAMVLRLPTPADAEALRKLLMVGAMSATIVAAGAIASMQPHAVPSTETIINRGPVAPPAQDFQERHETQTDTMLAAPPALAFPSDIVDDNVHSAPALPSAADSAASQAVSQTRSGSPTADFQERKEQAADDLLAAPNSSAGTTQADGPTRGGPQD
ncbi:MAG: hypothetical protein QOJ81_476 [Chloroflexota bacterium]|jgi:hypothetical protein|nr:hypothetical protein [Chloroflexota bacterium]